MDRQIAKLLTLAAEYDKGDPMRIQHFTKVHDFATAIGVLEGLDDETMRVLGGYSDEEIGRIKYLIGHHHTYTDTDGMDYQILVEADFLVNIYEDDLSAQTVENARERIFKTNAGIKLLEDMFRK